MHGWGCLCLKYREKLHGVPKSFMRTNLIECGSLPAGG